MQQSRKLQTLCVTHFALFCIAVCLGTNSMEAKKKLLKYKQKS